MASYAPAEASAVWTALSWRRGDGTEKPHWWLPASSCRKHWVCSRDRAYIHLFISSGIGGCLIM